MRFVFTMLVAAPLAAQQPPLTPFQEHRARTLLRDQLPCLGCHELDGDGGRIAPSLSTVGQRRSADYIRAIIHDPQSVVPGAAMPHTEMPASTRELIIRLLSRRSRRGPGPPPSNLSGALNVAPATLYATWCASCHGERGDGQGANARYLPIPPAVHASAELMSGRSDDALYDAIAGGGAVMGKSARMPAFGATLTQAEMQSLVVYIRALCSCAGPTWSRDATRLPP